MKTSFRKIETSSVIIAVVMFIGVMFMGYGYFNYSHLMLLVGLVTTGASAFAALVLMPMMRSRHHVR
jgi:multidrug efflux pump subunit AcrB